MGHSSWRATAHTGRPDPLPGRKDPILPILKIRSKPLADNCSASGRWPTRAIFSTRSVMYAPARPRTWDHSTLAAPGLQPFSRHNPMRTLIAGTEVGTVGNSVRAGPQGHSLASVVHAQPHGVRGRRSRRSADTTGGIREIPRPGSSPAMARFGQTLPMAMRFEPGRAALAEGPVPVKRQRPARHATVR